MRNPIRDYYKKIESGKIVVGEKVRRTYKKVVYDLDHPDKYHYSSNRAAHVIDFVQNFCVHSKGKWGGQKIKLELWEKAHLATVFGFIDDEGNRKYKESVLIVGKKNGKSLLASAVGLYMLIADGEQSPEVYSAATTRDQANIVWKSSKRMVNASPSLSKVCTLHVSDISTESFNAGEFRPLSSDVNTLDGKNPSCVLMDEIHQWKNGWDLYDILSRGTIAREQPLIYITTTAGDIREDIYDMKYDEAEQVINGYFNPDGYTDEERIFFIYELDQKSEYLNPKCWEKANPNLGVTKNAVKLAAEVERAKNDTVILKKLLCKDFNIRETSGDSWITYEDASNDATFSLTELQPTYYIGGIDLSETTDLTCATALFKVSGRDELFAKQMYFIPADLMEQRMETDKVPYDKWLDRGLIRLSTGNKINYHDIVDWFVELQEDYGMYLYMCGYDSWSAGYLVDEMEKNFGKVMEPVIQGARTLSSPMKSLHSDLQAKRINYDNNPITKWCICNTAVKTDRNGNIAPIHPRMRTKRIDGLSSLLDAYVEMERVLDSYNNLI